MNGTITTVFTVEADEFSIKVKLDTLTFSNTQYDVIMAITDSKPIAHTLMFTVQSVRQVADLVKMFMELVKTTHSDVSDDDCVAVHNNLVSTLINL